MRLRPAILLGDGQTATYDAAGNLLNGDPKVIEEEIVYLVETPTGRLEVLRPSEFFKRVGNGRK